MFGVDLNKLEAKLLNEVFLNLEEQDVEDIVKYNLAVKYVLDISELKQIACLAGTLVGASCFFAVSSPIIASACATCAIAGLIGTAKTRKNTKKFNKFYKALVVSLSLVYNASPQEVHEMLSRISADDLVDFLEKQQLLSRQEEA